MNIFQKVTLQSLKKNKVRTIVTIVGVILSAAMISAVTTFTDSMSNYMLQAAIASEGAWHGYVPDADIETTQEITGASEVAEASAMRHLGYALVDGNTMQTCPYVYVLASDQETEEMLSVRLIAGHYPTSGDEILLPEHLLNSNDNTFKIGDTITLAMGQRMVDGYYLTQGNPYQEEESLEVRETRTFTVAGVYRRLTERIESYEAPGYVAITGPDGNGDTDSRYDVFFTMNRPGDIYSFLEDHALNGKTNDRVLLYSGATDVSGFENVLRGLSAIVIGLIMFGSISLIYNAFSISVSERTKQFGLLSSVGATRKQLRGMVLFEALVVSVIGIPIGILSGILGIGVTLLFVGDLFASLLAGEGVPMTLCISAPSILVAIVVALVTVLISAWIPSGRATKVTAIEAIRQSRDIRPDKKVRRSSGLTYRLFGLPGVLASQHYRRSRKKYRATIFSLFMSIVLFVSASAFTDYMVTMAGQGLDVAGYDVSMSLRQDGLALLDDQQLLQQIRDMDQVGDVAYLNERFLSCLFDSQDVAPQYAQQLDQEGTGTVKMLLWLYFVDDESFRELLQQHGLSEAEYMDPQHPLAIGVDGSRVFNAETEQYQTVELLSSDQLEFTAEAQRDIVGYWSDGTETNDAGETVYIYRNRIDSEQVLELPEEEAMYSSTIRMGTRITDWPFFLSKSNGTTFLLPASAREAVFPGDGVVYGEYLITAEDHKAVVQELKNMALAHGAHVSPYDLAASEESDRNTITIIRVFSYGFVVLISLIAAANVFNTITTNIHLRRREFAMLKSVGMSRSGFNRMMNYECLLYGSRALLFGLPASLLVALLIHRSVIYAFDMPFRVPWKAMGISALSVFLVVFVTMLYAMSKIKKDDPIEALKNENT